MIKALCVHFPPLHQRCWVMRDERMYVVVRPPTSSAWQRACALLQQIPSSGCLSVRHGHPLAAAARPWCLTVSRPSATAMWYVLIPTQWRGSHEFWKCNRSKKYFSLVPTGEKGAPVALFGQSFASVWSEYEKETRLNLTLWVWSARFQLASNQV